MVVAIAAAAVSIGASAYTASSQSSAAKKAAQIQGESADQAIALQRQIYEQNRRDFAPWRMAGRRALNQLQDMTRAGPPEGFRGPERLDPNRFTFTPPTPESLANDPGYQFRLRTGQAAIESSAAARGGLLSGGTLKGLTEFGQDLGSMEYQNAYNRALGQNELRYGRAYTANQDAYNRALTRYQSDINQEGTQYNRLAGLAGAGQAATGNLANLGSAYAGNVGNLLTDKGSALSAGVIGSANAWSNFANTSANTLGNLAGMYTGSQRPPSSTGYPYPGYPY